MVLHVTRPLAVLGLCLSCYQAAGNGGQGLHGSLCFASTVLDCVSAGGVVGPVSLSLFPLQQLLQGPSCKADIRKCINIWSLLNSTFGHKQTQKHFLNAADVLKKYLYTLIKVVELKDFRC